MSMIWDNKSQANWRPQTAGSLLADVDETLNWIIKPLVIKGGVTSIQAPPKTGKTYFMLLMSLMVSMGFKPDNIVFEPQMAKCWYLAYEDGLPRVRRRLKELLRGLGIWDEWMPQEFMLSAIPPTLWANPEDGKTHKIIDACRAEGISVLIIDTLSHTHAAPEIDARQMHQVMQNLRSVAQAGITVIVTHHVRKAGRETKDTASVVDRSRGSVAIPAGVDAVLDLTYQSPGVGRLEYVGRDEDPARWAVQYNTREIDGKRAVSYRIYPESADGPPRDTNMEAKEKLKKALLAAGKAGLSSKTLEGHAGLSGPVTRSILAEMATSGTIYMVREHKGNQPAQFSAYPPGFTPSEQPLF